MSGFKRIAVTVVVVDSGPLISLAACDSLPLLNAFRRRVRITDVVREECLRHSDKVGFEKLSVWFAAVDGEAFKIVETPLLDLWASAVAQENAGDATRPSKGVGDASIAWLLQRISSSSPKEEVILLLSDDGPFGDGYIRQRTPEVYMLSTRMYLQVLQNFGIVPSARVLLDQIAAAGRTAARYAADRPGRLAPGVKSQWTDVLGGTGSSDPDDE